MAAIRGDVILRMDLLNSSDKDITLISVYRGPALPVLLTKASFSRGDNGVRLEDCCVVIEY